VPEQDTTHDLEGLKQLELTKWRWTTIDTQGCAVLSQWATLSRDASGALFGFVSGAGWPEMAHRLSDELTRALNQLPAIILALEQYARIMEAVRALERALPGYEIHGGNVIDEERELFVVAGLWPPREEVDGG